MRVLVIGNGAREHALAYGLSQDPTVTEVHISPGNPGMTAIATLHPEVAGSPARGDDGEQMRTLAQDIKADLVVIGPEIPLVAGVADTLREAGFSVFGPSAAAAQIEGSKAFAKEIMAATGVRTAHAEQLLPDASEEEIHAAIDRFGPTWVVKDDGLAGGKGVVVTPNREEAIAHVRVVHEGGNPVLLESFLEGPEVSLFCLVDGETVVPLLPAQDHKRVGEGDTGSNTGGMGAYTPLPWLPEDGVQRIVDEVVRPVAAQMKKQGCPFNGLLYAGLAWGKQGPAVVEFNCRFGDPETQAVLDLLRTPLGTVLHAVAVGELDQLPPLEWEEGYALTVVLAAEGYPEKPITGVPLRGVQVGQEGRGIRAAGVSSTEDGSLVSAGGRVLNVIARGATLDEARTKAYEVLEGIHLEGGHYRRDIALPAVEGRISLP